MLVNSWIGFDFTKILPSSLLYQSAYLGVHKCSLHKLHSGYEWVFTCRSNKQQRFSYEKYYFKIMNEHHLGCVISPCYQVWMQYTSRPC